MLVVAAFAAGLLLAQAAQPAPPAEPAASAAAPAGKAEKPKKPRMICTEETPVGSVISKRVCRTPEEVEAERAATRRNTDNMMDHLATCRGPSC
jgi:hypothetical protein